MSEYIVKCTEMIGISGNLIKIPDYIDLNSEIVRCRDCKYRYGCLHLVDNGDDDMRHCHATPDGFCSWAERRTDDNASSNA